MESIRDTADPDGVEDIHSWSDQHPYVVHKQMVVMAIVHASQSQPVIPFLKIF